eukprot:1138223-Pelagomonas_calceolata.AAC.6
MCTHLANSLPRLLAWGQAQGWGRWWHGPEQGSMQGARTQSAGECGAERGSRLWRSAIACRGHDQRTRHSVCAQGCQGKRLWVTLRLEGVGMPKQVGGALFGRKRGYELRCQCDGFCWGQQALEVRDSLRRA